MSICHLKGEPIPNVRWDFLRDGKWEQISNSDKYEMDMKWTGGDEALMYWLEIKNVQANNYGQYRCTGENKEGSCSESVELFG